MEIKLIYCSQCDAPELSTRMGEVVLSCGEVLRASMCTCGGYKKIIRLDVDKILIFKSGYIAKLGRSVYVKCAWCNYEAVCRVNDINLCERHYKEWQGEVNEQHRI